MFICVTYLQNLLESRRFHFAKAPKANHETTEKKKEGKESFVKPKQSKDSLPLFGVRRLDAAFFLFFAIRPPFVIPFWLRFVRAMLSVVKMEFHSNDFVFNLAEFRQRLRRQA